MGLMRIASAARMTVISEQVDATVDRFALHHHAGASAVWVVVHSFPFIQCVVTQVVEMNLCETLLLSTCQDGLVEESLQHLRQYCDNIYSHIECKDNII